MGNPSLVPPSSKMEHQYQNLRLELKEWEKSFAAENEGRKAGREDIKQHPDIGTTTLGTRKHR